MTNPDETTSDTPSTLVADQEAKPTKRRPGRPRKATAATADGAEKTAAPRKTVRRKKTPDTPSGEPPTDNVPPSEETDTQPPNRESSTNQDSPVESKQGPCSSPHSNGATDAPMPPDSSTPLLSADIPPEPDSSIPAPSTTTSSVIQAPPEPRLEPVPPTPGEGIVELSGKGFGFLRDPKRNYQQTPRDVFIRPEIVRKFALRDGYYVTGLIRKGHRGPQLDRLETINGEPPEHYQRLPHFEELTSTNPCEWLRLETTPDRFTTRVIDLMAPIGKGQRGLIVAPPRTGKTTLLQHIAEAISQNYPEMPLFILLVDERPEEVTEITRACPTAVVMASSNDNDLKHHTRIAQLAIERAKRLVERGKDVFMLMDSITRIGRAFNNATSNSGRTLSGGIDAKAMEIPRRLFAAARNTEEAGSLTIIATALIETGSRMDEYIFQEFKGTGNMELVLDRRISDMRIYPAIDIFLSGTRREELLIPADLLEKISIIRRGLSGHKPIEAIERLLSFLKKFPRNEQMLREIPAA